MVELQDDTARTEPLPKRDRKLPGSGKVRIGAVVALAIAVGLVVWLLTRGDDAPKGTSGPTAGQVLSGIPAGTHVGPIPLDAAGLANTATALHQPVYWLGPKKGYTYQLERAEDGNVFLIYLPPGVAATSDRSKYLVVGSYPFQDPVDALRSVGQKAGNEIVDLENGGIAVPGKAHPLSVWVAYSSGGTEIEVFSPKAGEARRLALSGTLRLAG